MWLDNTLGLASSEGRGTGFTMVVKSISPINLLDIHTHLLKDSIVKNGAKKVVVKCLVLWGHIP